MRINQSPFVINLVATLRMCVVALSLCVAGCASGGRLPIDLTKIPIVIGPPAPSVTPVAPTPAKPRATLAFEVLDQDSGGPVSTAFATCDDGVPKQANEQGYIAVERELGLYTCRFEADDYAPATRRFQLEANRQFTVTLKSTKPAPSAAPRPEPPSPQAPEPAPPVVAPPPAPVSPLCADRDRAPIKCVRAAAATYPELLTINTYESCVEFTQRVLATLGPDWGHVGKTAGEGQSVPRGFVPIEVHGHRITGVSHDAIKHRLTGQVVDLIAFAAARSDPRPHIHRDAEPIWDRVAQFHPSTGELQWRENNPFVPAVPVR